MKFSLAEKIALTLGMLTLVAIVITLNLVQRMSDAQETQLSGQWIEVGGSRTERFVGESNEVWKARALEAVRSAEEVRDASEDH